MAEHLIERLQLNADRPFARAFLDAADRMTDGKLWLLAAGGAAYAFVRFVEAWGLWMGRTWAQYFAILSGAIYLPWEAYEVARTPTPLHISLLSANAIVVLYLLASRFRQTHAPQRGWFRREPRGETHEPRWPSLVALVSVGILQLVLPEPLTAGPSWLLLLVIGIGAVPAMITHQMRLQRLNQATGYVLLAVSTASMVWALAGLLSGVLGHVGTPAVLLRSAALLWISNILVFASWYWRLDAGGPHARSTRARHREGAFLFPQMTIDEERYRNWRPGFVDYLFLAFTTSTAFSPTDSPVLSKWAKALTMLQSVISLATIAVVAARAVNVL